MLWWCSDLWCLVPDAEEHSAIHSNFWRCHSSMFHSIAAAIVALSNDISFHDFFLLSLPPLDIHTSPFLEHFTSAHQHNEHNTHTRHACEWCDAGSHWECDTHFWRCIFIFFRFFVVIFVVVGVHSFRFQLFHMCLNRITKFETHTHAWNIDDITSEMR